jgi:streptomycin 6-kinase
VLAQDEHALLLERPVGTRSLPAMVANGQDDDASRILCAVAARLHAPRPGTPPDLLPLSHWFQALAPAANALGGILAEAHATARKLLATPRDITVLHGDIHHGNVLDAGARGWIAIDPKGLLGERSFDFVNILRNPEASTALAPGRFIRQVEVVATAAALDRRRLIEWTLAFAGLSAAWAIAGGESAALDLAVATLAAEVLSRP